MKKLLILSILVLLVIAIIIRFTDDSNYDMDNLVTNPSSNQDQVIENKVQEIKHDIPDTTSPINNEILTTLEISRLIISKPEQILFRAGYVVSYNSDTKNPNWVAWHLTKEHTDGPYHRDGVPYYDEEGKASGIGIVNNENFKNPYFLDGDIESPKQEFRDWYDKRYHVNHGHLCPAGDNKWSKEAMNQSFYLSNMCPQDIDLNGGDWEGLEKRCRGWAKQYDDLHIVAGPIFYGDQYRTMGEGNVGIPDAFFKVILRMKDIKGGENPKTLGFLFPNEGTHHDLINYLKTVDEIEEITGFDFFSDLPDSIESVIEATGNLELW